MKIVAWDLETTNLNANFGFILCGGYKTIGEKSTHLVSISESKNWKSDPTNDKELCKRLSGILGEADVWVTWYGKRFDVPYLQSRLLVHGLPVLPPVPHIDGWMIAKYKLKLHSNRLAAVASTLGLSSKTPVLGPQWVKAMAGDRKSLRYIEDHCRRDVEVLEEAYQILKPLCPDHPNHRLVIGAGDACPVCGADALQRRGEYVSRTRVYQRFHCQKCGAWSKGSRSLRSVSHVSV